jgi:hypothetical protein
LEIRPVIIIFGEKSYGKVDRVPGVSYVVTIFAHLNFLPLIPVRSFLVVEGTEEGGQFRGKQVSVCLKSVLAGYVRVWCGLVMLIAGAIAGVGTLEAAVALGLNPLVQVALLAAGLGAVVCLFVGGKFGAVVQVGVHLTSAILWYVLQDAAGQNVRRAGGVEGTLAALAIANLALLLYGLTRLFDHAGPARRRELLEELGVDVPPEDGDEQPQQERWEDWDAAEDRRRR